MPTASVDLVAYLARYEATAMLASWPPAAGSWMVRVSSWAPHRISQPPGRAGWATVANHVEAAAAWIASSSSGTLFQTYARSFDRVWDQTRKTWTGQKVTQIG